MWARENPQSGEVVARKIKQLKVVQSKAREAGIAISSDSADSIAWNASEPIEMLWTVRVAVPFSYAASKNHIYGMTRFGHKYLRKESTAFRDELTLRLQNALRSVKVAHNKVWLDILVQKTNHRGDAVNVLDLVCDAAKVAVGVDDRWFSIRRLDWQVTKSNPKIFIGLSQDSDLDCQVCSYCGRVLELEMFCKKRKNKLGVTRECKECLAAGRKLAKGA